MEDWRQIYDVLTVSTLIATSVGMSASIWAVSQSWRDLSVLQRNGPHLLVASKHLRNDLFRLGVQLVLLAIAALTFGITDLIPDTMPSNVLIILALRKSFTLLLSLMVMVDVILDHHDRIQLKRMLEYYNGRGAEISPE